MWAFRSETEPMQTLLILLIVGIILYNLGAGLYYMLVDKGQTKRTVNALTRRVAFSVLLIALIIIGIVTGVIQPHGIHG
ncbi:MAG TPA: twin transmembrane helix small protein [Aquimonas sp.]|nr:twin transmembrane helix small protein [Xanthomonadales bacterium]HRD73856.1 twin transmembrane helix small protein [Aquimonas sp.]HRF55335.1 twin transmembrane helix small protein [Aquimonas sp.]